MMKYRYTYYVLLCLTLVGLASCEMKDELLGKGEQGGSGEVGVLDLKLKLCLLLMGMAAYLPSHQVRN